MKKEQTVELTIDTPAIGNILMEVGFESNEDDNFVLKIPSRQFVYTEYTLIDLSHVIEQDIENFKKLNEHADENHQVYIDTLCVFGVKIVGNYIRIQYWFNQDGNVESHRMCAGCLTYCRYKSFMHEDKQVVFPECYSSDVCVYW